MNAHLSLAEKDLLILKIEDLIKNKQKFLIKKKKKIKKNY